jgi:hypothetical protein
MRIIQVTESVTEVLYLAANEYITRNKFLIWD